MKAMPLFFFKGGGICYSKCIHRGCFFHLHSVVDVHQWKSAPRSPAHLVKWRIFPCLVFFRMEICRQKCGALKNLGEISTSRFSSHFSIFFHFFSFFFHFVHFFHFFFIFFHFSDRLIDWSFTVYINTNTVLLWYQLLMVLLVTFSCKELCGVGHCSVPHLAVEISFGILVMNNASNVTLVRFRNPCQP